MPASPAVHPAELDEMTLHRARRGEPEAFRALVERYQRPVFALLSRMLAPVGKATLVEDLAQETFLRVFRSLPAFDPGGPARLSTWIFTIATRLALDELRKRRFQVPLQDDVAGGTRSHQEAMETRLAQRSVERALQQLPDEQRAVVILRIHHELSLQEISTLMEVEVGTVKSRLSRAREALSHALGVHHE